MNMVRFGTFVLIVCFNVLINLGNAENAPITEDWEEEFYTEDFFPTNVTDGDVSRLRFDRPGFKARITQKGFNFAARMAINILMKELKTIQIPAVDTKAGPANVHVDNIRIVRFSRPRSSLAPIPWPGYGLRWKATHLNPIIKADYEAAFDMGLWTIRKSGTVTVEANDLQFHLEFFMGMEEGGRPTVEVLACDCTGDLDIDFVGQWSDLLNVGSTLFNSQIESLVTAQICFQAKQEINTKLGEQFMKMPLIHNIKDEYLFNLSMVYVPIIHPDAMEIGLSGAVQLVDDPQEPPYIPPEIPVRHQDTDKMFYATMTDYVINSAFYATYLNDLLAYEVTADMVPEEHRGYLNTSCEIGAICLGTVFPTLSELYPDEVVGMFLGASEPPRISVLGNVVNVTLYGVADVYVAMSEEEKPVFGLGITVNGSFALDIVNNSVVVDLKDISTSVEVLDSNIGDIGSGFFFESILRVITQQVLKPKITELGQKGFGIPEVQGIHFVDPVIIQSDTPGVFTIGADIGFDLKKKKRMMAKRKIKKQRLSKKKKNIQ